ncbi:MAG: hypothetical protein IKO91_06755 [Oscillospiraceae bacterium]|nr:hypothetical protein [Oscillospiraceae bacterium]
MNMKEGLGWKACYNEEKGVYGGEVMFQGSWDLYEISAAVFGSLSKGMPDSEAERLISSGRRLYSHVNDRYSPPYNIVLDEDYADFCPWMKKAEPVGKTWDRELTDTAVELFESEKDNREQRRKKREQRKKGD